MITRIFTDGGATKNGQINCRASWAVVELQFKQNNTKQTNIKCNINHNEINNILSLFKKSIHGYDIDVICRSGLLCKKTYNPPTNNKAELFAILFALKEYNNIEIYTDSMYSLNSITKWYKNWINKNVQKLNMDLIGECYDIMESKNITLKYIKAHRKIIPTDNDNVINYFGNQLADKLCNNILYG